MWIASKDRSDAEFFGLSYLKGIKKSNHHRYSHQNRHPNRHPNRHLDRRLGRYLDRRIARPVRNHTPRDLEYLESPGGLQLGTLIVEGILWAVEEKASCRQSRSCRKPDV